MADDDFDIDIYGDANTEEVSLKKDEEGDIKIEGIENTNGNETGVESQHHHDGQYDDSVEIKTESNIHNNPQLQQQIKSTDESGHDVLTIPKKAPQQQGVKRKEGSDDRPIDASATSAILISDLHWWNTDDDIRGWANQAQCEDELKDITFSEYKANGKTKGQAYVEFTSQQAATAAKRKIDAFGEGQQYVKKHSVAYSNPNVNPFRTLPKDAPTRAGKDGSSNRSGVGAYNDQNRQNNNFRGRTPSYNPNRGNTNNMGGGFSRNFSGPSMGSMSGGFQQSMGGFQGGAMGSQFGGFNRGGMMGGMRGGSVMRGGRGAMSNGMMGSIPMNGMAMGGMPMGGMGGPMGMGQMGGVLPGANFQGLQPHFNPAFFQQNQATGGDWQNPHGAKRPRPE